MTRLGKIYGGKLDPEYSAALYLLTAYLGLWQKVSGYVSRTGLDIEGMLEELDLCGGHTVLVQWAGNLFNGLQHIDPLELMRLDESNFHLALASLKLRRYSLRVNDLQ
jgi:hypothetical protein